MGVPRVFHGTLKSTPPPYNPPPLKKAPCGEKTCLSPKGAFPQKGAYGLL